MNLLNIGAQPPIGGSGLLKESGIVRPETGNFDFMSYLLGLQVATTPQAPPFQMAPSNAAGSQGTNPQSATDPIASLFSQSNGSLSGLNFPSQGMETQGRLSSLDTGTISLEQLTGDSVALGATTQTGNDLTQLQNELVDVSESQSSVLSELRNSLNGLNGEIRSAKSLDASPIPSLNNNGQVRREEGLRRYSDVLTLKRETQPNPVEIAPQLSESAALPLVFGEKESATDDGLDLLNGTQVRSNDNAGQGVIASVMAPSTPTNPFATKVNEAIGESPVPIHSVREKINGLVERGGGEMVITLDPPHLGKLEVAVSVKGKQVDVELRPQLEVTKTLLETNASDLKGALRSHDLILSKLEVHLTRHDLTDTSLGSSFLTGNGAEHPKHRAADFFNQSSSDQRSGEGRSLNASSSSSRPVLSTIASTTWVNHGGTGRIDRKV